MNLKNTANLILICCLCAGKGSDFLEQNSCFKLTVTQVVWKVRRLSVSGAIKNIQTLKNLFKDRNTLHLSSLTSSLTLPWPHWLMYYLLNSKFPFCGFSTGHSLSPATYFRYFLGYLPCFS